ncbi:hypothetical protein GCM10011410_01690 [Hoyosella rhizosphaerae]|uniref:Fe/B12 periplasmic-binding domain-containing protein n=1 Tax=Hoyosella rhizosphaerae TaxID=1755582 RepID=A0A916X8X3_9ACTN|nr:hypothetical protein GCM10011410_01690 [Hoyosella rhizosphaerae]
MVFFNPARTLDGVADQIRAVANALGVNAAGEDLANRITGDIKDVRAEIPETDPPLRIAFLYLRGTGTQLIAGPGSGADELITAVGAECAGTAAGLANPVTPITSEALIDASPDVLILMQSGLDSVRGVDGLLTIPGIKQTPAGRDARIVTLDETGMLSFGPRTPDTIRAVAAATYES